MAKCNRCDKPHLTEVCPYYANDRIDHEDAIVLPLNMRHNPVELDGKTLLHQRLLLRKCPVVDRVYFGVSFTAYVLLCLTAT